MCQGIPLATKGIIYKPTIIARYILPLDLRLTKETFNLTLKKIEPFKLNLFKDNKKINLSNVSIFKLNNRLINNFKLNLKKCED